MVRFKIPEMNRKNQVLLILALIIIAIPSYFIYDYTQHNPKFCTTCHLMNTAYVTWDQSAMHDLDCHKCHESDMVENLDHVVEVVFENPQHVTKITEVDNELCLECHASYNYQWMQVMTTDGHRTHFFEREMPPDCIDCHGLNLHVFKPSEEICLDCHDKDTSMDTPEASLHCIDCHEFSSRVLFPTSDDCVNCHDFARTQTIMDKTSHQKVQVETDCMSCHNPHTENKYEDCLVCHTLTGTGLHENTSHQLCELCHVPHRSTGLREICLSCHLDRETHYPKIECELCHSFIS
ncbi:hypothetical protein ACFL0D_06050 [Thermoproteota archaeon]